MGLDRRDFLRIVAVTGGGAAVAAAGPLLRSSQPGGFAGASRYVGGKVTAGPAPQGVPVIPLRVNPEGLVEGVPHLSTSPVPHSLEWYRFCGYEESPGLQATYEGDNVLRYFETDARLQSAERQWGRPLWFSDRLGQPVRPSDFTEVGQGALVRWRSSADQGFDMVQAIVIRVDPASMAGIDSTPFRAGNLMAYSARCTHFCCNNGYRQSEIARASGNFDMMFCTCHDSVFDPLQLEDYALPATARKD